MNNRIFGPDIDLQQGQDLSDAALSDRMALRQALAEDESKGAAVVIVNVTCLSRASHYVVWHYRLDGWKDPL